MGSLIRRPQLRKFRGWTAQFGRGRECANCTQDFELFADDNCRDTTICAACLVRGLYTYSYADLGQG